MTWSALRTWDTPTPLIELGPGLDLPRGVRLFAKLETVNAGGSIKDRPVSFMLARAMAEGHLSDGRRLLDSSSGNAGIAYAMLGAAAGVGVTLVIPGNASRERLDRIAAHGAEVITTDPVEGYDFAIETARRMAEAEPERYWYADQYSNEQNWQAHYQTTGAEIEEQVRARAGEAPDAFIAGVGTGGTITGVGRRLRRVRPDTHLAVVVPEPFPGIEGLKPLGSPGDLVPEILDPSLIDERIPVRSEDAAATARLLARRGLFVGPSSGAFVFAAAQLARRGGFRTLATLLCDTGERYASTGMWARDARPEAERSTSRGTTP
ncbi:cysteine synthase [Acidobacteria bacterium Mor1]|nr:cysteine synthase [Acidobacteria bacterium Mor1]